MVAGERRGRAVGLGGGCTWVQAEEGPVSHGLGSYPRAMGREGFTDEDGSVS